MRNRLFRIAIFGWLTSTVLAAGVSARAFAAVCSGATPNACGTTTGVTYNGAPLTLAGVKTNGTVNVEIWYLTAPATGAHNVVVTAPYPTDVTAASISFTGVNQTTPLGAIVGALGTSTTPSVTPASGIAGEPSVDFMGAVGTTTPTIAGTTQTLRHTNNTSSGVNHVVLGNSTSFGQTTSVPMAWTIPSADWAIAEVPVHAAAALTGVDVSSFTATWRGDGTFVSWHTGYQPDSVGFYVYRSNGGGARTLLNKELIDGDAIEGAQSSFSWTDSTAGWNGDVAYWLQEVRQNGSTTWYGPASPVPPIATQPIEPATASGPDASVDAFSGVGGAAGTRTFEGATGAPGAPSEVTTTTTTPQGGCMIATRSDRRSTMDLFLLAGVVWSACRRRRRWVWLALFLALLVTSIGTPTKAAMSGGVAVDATATATGASGLTFAHTMGAAANGLLVVGVVTPITCTATATDSGSCGTCGATCALDTTTLTTGLLSLWHFDEGAGTTSADSSGNGNTVTLTGSPSWTSGYENDALQFNGSSSFATGTIGGTFGTNATLSAAAWVYVTSNTNGPVFGVTGPGGWTMPFLSVKGSTVYGWVWYGGGGGTPMSATVGLNAWHLLSITYDPSGSGTQEFYVDGALSGTTTGTYNPSNGTAVFTTDITGAKPAGVNSILLGRIDEVRAYNRVLSAAEETTLFNARLSCSGSTCAACMGGETSCSGSCVTTATDNNNCGACGHVCNTAGGETCISGTCGCLSGTDCSTYCVATATDPNNCGTCGMTCSNSTPTFVDSGLLGYWKLNEGSGASSADASGNGNTATLTNSPTWTTGYSGDGLSFDGATNYLTATIGTWFGSNNNLSASAWVYATSTANGPVFGVSNGAWRMPFLSINGANVYGWVWYGVTGGTAMSATVSLNAWHHLAVTYDPSSGGTQKFYVDGTLSGTTAGTYNPSGTSDNLTTLITGAKPTGVLSYMNGRIDELRAYNRTLSASEISIIVNARSTCSASSCNATCASGETSCSGVCTLTSVDSNNCGTCGHACNTAGGEICSGGTCGCGTGQTDCSGTCYDLTSNINHCGTCTTTCNPAGGETCISSACGCASGTDCSSVCTDTTSSSTSCGTCGHACAATTCLSCSQGLLGQWHFDEGVGTTSADASGNGNTATLVNPTWTSPGETGAGSSVTFSGSPNYFHAPLGTWFGTAGNPISASAWVYATSTSNGPIFGVTNVVGGGSWDMPFLSINGATVYGWFWQVNGNTPLSATVTLNNWHFLAVTYDPSGSGTESFYVDGVLSSTGTGTFSVNPAGTRYVTSYIPGATPATVNSYLNGQIDELSAFKRVLSAGEVRLMYSARQVCTASTCSGCPTGTTSCSSACTNTLADTNNCSASNACGTVCGSGKTCVAGTCM